MILLVALTLVLTGCVLPTQAVDLEGQMWEQMDPLSLIHILTRGVVG